MKKKIIYIAIQILDERNYYRYGLDYFLKNNWEVEYWDVKNAIFPRLNKNFISNNPLMNLNSVTCITFNNFFQVLKKTVEKKNNFIFIDAIEDTFKALLLKKLLYFKGGKKIVRANFNIRFTIFQPNLFKILLKSGFFRFFLYTIKLVLLTIKIKLVEPLLDTKPSVHFTFGSKEYANSIKKYGHGIQCKAHTATYDIYLKDLKNDIVSDDLKNKIVFIDQDFPLPYDRRLKTNKPLFSEKKYWNSVNSFLDLVEKKYNKEVIIARHPRGNLNKNISKKRTLQHQTSQLIKNSFIVICHNSMAIQFAILWKKPLILVTTNDLDHNITENYNLHHHHAKELKKKVINVDNFTKNEIENEIKVYNNIYEKYIVNYISDSHSPNLPFWSMAVEEINKRFFN